MTNFNKTLPVFLLLVLLALGGYSQKAVDIRVLIKGKWDLLTENKSSKLNDEDLEFAKAKAKQSKDNSNKAIYIFGEDGKFNSSSIRDYSMSDEEGSYEFSADEKTLTRTVKYPKHLKASKSKKFTKIKSEVLYIDNEVLVLKQGKMVAYFRKI